MTHRDTSRDILNPSASQQAVAYVRVSTSKQADSGIGETVQRIDIDRWAQANGLAVRVYTDAGVSGQRIKRPTLLAAIADAKRSGCPLVVTALSRLARTTRQTLQLIEQITTGVRPVTLVSLKESIDTRTAMGKCMITMISAVNQLEADLASERTTSSMQSLRAQGRRTGGALPFGYIETERTTDESGKVVTKIAEDPRFTWIIDEIIALRAAGLSLRRIAFEINSRGIRTSQGKQWQAQQVSSVLAVMRSRRERVAA
jgi:DNA invertase Pin-like site-specific DNA recombinase